MSRLKAGMGMTAAAFAALLAWGYWHGATHAALYIYINDVGLRTPNQLYGQPHNVAMDFRDDRGNLVAGAHSAEPHGYYVAIHPDQAIGDCRQFEASPDRDNYADCFGKHSAWQAKWASSVRTADLRMPGCVLANVPVQITDKNSGWWYWWVPLPHVGGTPYRYVSLQMWIDSRACKAVDGPP